MRLALSHILPLCLLLSCASHRGLDILSPTQDGVVIGNSAKFVIQCESAPRTRARVDGKQMEIPWTKLPNQDLWTGDLQLPRKGAHAVVLKGTCGKHDRIGEVHFDNSIESSVEIADLAIAPFIAQNSPEKLAWDWGPAIFLYPLLKIAPKSAHKTEYIDYVERYHRWHADKGLPTIRWADHCPSALSAFDLAKSYQKEFAWSSVETVIDWIKTAERNDLGSIDHLGTNNIRAMWFPRSIWIDSLVMWTLIAVKYALHKGDDQLLEFGLEQSLLFADKLRNPETGLFVHAWNIEKNRSYPENHAHWLRGHGWALVAMVEILQLIGKEHERYRDLAEVFVNLAQATRPHRLPSGYWDTVLDAPGYAYEESSGSALIATAYAKGNRLGLLPDAYRELARDTFQAITARMKRRETGFTVEEISRMTIPASQHGYKLVGKGRNISYGVGAFVLLADELADDSFDRENENTPTKSTK